MDIHLNFINQSDDVDTTEVVVFAPMIAVVLWMGVYPSSFMRPMQPSIANLIERVQLAVRADAVNLAER